MEVLRISGLRIYRYFQDKGFRTYEDIAKELGVSIGTVHTLVNKNVCGIRLLAKLIKYNIPKMLMYVDGKKLISQGREVIITIK